MKSRISLSCALAAVAYAATGLAGFKADEVANVVPGTLFTLANAAGSPAATRGSPDAMARIGCWVVGTPTTLTGYCLATDPNGMTLACSSTSSNILRTIQAVSPTAHIAFTTAVDGTCDNVVIDDGSAYGAKR